MLMLPERLAAHNCYITPSSNGPQSTLKTVFNAWNGYYGILLREDRHYTTFFTPWGWVGDGGGWVNQAYSRLSTTHGHITDCKLLVHTMGELSVSPAGYIASGDTYSRRFDEI